MTFVVGTAIIIGGATLGAAAISANASKKAAATAAGGSQDELGLIRESRDIARADQAPYREAGYTALNALMSLTGLGGGSGGGGGGGADSPSSADPGAGGINAEDYLSGLGQLGDDNQGGLDRDGRYVGPGRPGVGRIHHRAYGGPIARNQGGTVYNVNEFGPERIYENGSYTRSDMPKTISPGGDGYVAPNYPAIQGAGFGSFLKKAIQPFGGSIGKYADPITTKLLGNSGGDKYGSTTQPVGWGGPRRIETGGPAGPNTPIPNQDFGNPLDGTYQPPGENPGGVEGGYKFQTDPGYNFRLGEGMRTLERGAAARGGLLSGGYGRRSTRYAQDYASNEYTNVYNRISNIAGLGQVSANQSGNAALQAGQGMGTAAAQGAYASAYGQQASGNAWANAANQLGQLPWGQIFGGGGGGGSQPSVPYGRAP